MTGDDRLGKRALFSVPADDPGPQPAGVEPPEEVLPGRRAFFTAPSAGASPGQVVVGCGRCRARPAVGPVGLVRALTPSLWLPFGRYNRWMRCPACRRLSWCRIEWLAALRPG